MPPVTRFTREGVLEAAYRLVRREGPSALNARAVATLCQCMQARAEGSRNPYISVCMTYLLFSRDEPQLFKLLFMRDRSSDGINGREYKHEWGFPIIESSFGVDRETAIKLYERSFFYTHGLAVCIATKYMPCMSEEDMEYLVTENLRAAALQLGLSLENN